MKDYTQLTEVERYPIAVLFQRGHRQNEIAETLGRSPSTISRESSVAIEVCGATVRSRRMDWPYRGGKKRGSRGS